MGHPDGLKLAMPTTDQGALYSGRREEGDFTKEICVDCHLEGLSKFRLCGGSTFSLQKVGMRTVSLEETLESQLAGTYQRPDTSADE